MIEDMENARIANGHDTTSDLEALKIRIMGEIELKLSQKEDALWRRGQREIMKLQQEQQQVTGRVNQLQDQHTALMAETTRLQTALYDVTSKFETVVNEMREVLHALPQRKDRHIASPTPSVASTSASLDVAKDVQSSESTRETRDFCTPPRGPVLAEDIALQGDTTGGESRHTMTGSPTVLSLASALPSASATSAVATSGSSLALPGLKRLHLAECLEQKGCSTATTASVTAGTASPRSPLRHGELAQSVTVGLAVQSPAPQLDIVVELNKERTFVTLGIEVNQVDSTSLCVESIDEHGLVGRHNARQDSETSQVHVGDRILEVNGIRHDPNRMLQECKEKQRLIFAIARDIMPGAAKDATPSSMDDGVLNGARQQGSGRLAGAHASPGRGASLRAVCTGTAVSATTGA